MSKTAVANSGEVNVRLASVFSKLPAMGTDAFTLNLIELSALMISKTGTPCAGVDDAASPTTTTDSATTIVLAIQFIHLLLFEFRPQPEDDVGAYRFAQRREDLCKIRHATP